VSTPAVPGPWNEPSPRVPKDRQIGPDLGTYERIADDEPGIFMSRPHKPSPERPLREAALELGCDGRTLLSWTERGCPVATRGAQAQRRGWRFRVADVVAWLREREREQSETRYASELAELRAALAGAGPVSVSMSHAEAKRRRAVAESRLAEFRANVLERRLADVDLVVAEVARDYAGVRARVLQIANRAAPRLVGIEDHATAFELLHEEACEALRDLSSDSASEAVDRALDRGEGELRP